MQKLRATMVLPCMQRLAKKRGYDQVIWTDALEHKYVQEIGTMNVIFIIGNKAITPDLAPEPSWPEYTRDSVLTLLKEAGFTVEERPLSIDEIIDAYKAGTFMRFLERVLPLPSPH